MPVLNLRNVPDKLMRELRAQAALDDKDFHPFCLMLLEKALETWRRPVVTVHPAIETMGPATRAAVHEVAAAAVSFYRDSMMEIPAPPREPLRPYELAHSAAPDLPAENPEIEIT